MPFVFVIFGDNFLEMHVTPPFIKLAEDRNKKLSRVINKYVFHVIKRRQQFVDSKIILIRLRMIVRK